VRVLGLDVGGANLKAADTDCRAVTRSFALWKAADRLPAEIGRLLAQFPRPDRLAVTMTAELADCYRTKQEGVDAILAAVEASAGSIPIAVWQTGGSFVEPEVARRSPLKVAAANWHALATFVGRFCSAGGALLVDVGTTTTDVIPLTNGLPVPVGLTDRERLQSRELVYTGVRRTPVCAVAPSVPFRDGNCPIAAELFATTLDVYLILRDLPENETDTETANGRPATIPAARDRLARCLCCDAAEFGVKDTVTVAEFLAAAQRRQIAQAISCVVARQPAQPSRVIVSGSGAFLAEHALADCPRMASADRVAVASLLGPGVSEAACAFAVAQLAAERVAV
jgi:(4-(4-[2-(gamma-L-glutamylamino)ethyl]phenoxymethyl)furan-2-yl)methanamine synthase